MADTMPYQSHPLAVLAAGLLAQPDESWRHLEALRFAGARRPGAEVQIRTHPRFRLRTRTWRSASRYSTRSR